MTDEEILDLLDSGKVEVQLRGGEWYAIVIKGNAPWVALPTLRGAVIAAVRVAGKESLR